MIAETHLPCGIWSRAFLWSRPRPPMNAETLTLLAVLRKLERGSSKLLDAACSAPSRLNYLLWKPLALYLLQDIPLKELPILGTYSSEKSLANFSCPVQAVWWEGRFSFYRTGVKRCSEKVRSTWFFRVLVACHVDSVFLRWSWTASSTCKFSKPAIKRKCGRKS